MWYIVKTFKRWELPRKNIFLWLMFLKRPLYFGFIKKLIIKYTLRKCKNVDLIAWFQCLYGNIIWNNIFLGNTFFLDYEDIIIWDNTKISWWNTIISWSHDYYNDFNTVIAKPIHIWKNCWITTNCTILPWVKIWDNVVLSAWSVASIDIPANCIASGNPAKPIKFIK